MGKVVKAVAVIAISAAIAYFAPGIGLAALHAFGSTAVAGSFAATLAATVVTTIGMGALGLAMQALSPSPHTTTAPGMQPSRAQPQQEVNFRWTYPPEPEGTEMFPVLEPWWRDRHFLPWQRYAVLRVRGDCMVPVMPAGTKWVVIDRSARIQRNDLFLIRPDDLAQYLRMIDKPPNWASGLVKRFIGVDSTRRVVVYECTNPYARIETGLDRVLHLYRVVSHHGSWAAAVCAKFRLVTGNGNEEAGGAKRDHWKRRR